MRNAGIWRTTLAPKSRDSRSHNLDNETGTKLMKKLDRPEVDNGNKIWCEHCSIRIAPNESRVASDGKIYHQRCYEKYCAADSKMRVASAGSGTVLGRKR